MKIEIKKGKGVEHHMTVGLCPHCRQGSIRLTVVDGQLDLDCYVSPKYPDPCYAKFYWGNYNSSKVICGVTSIDPEWARKHGVSLPPLEQQKGYEFGEVVAEGDKRFFVSSLDPY